MLIGSTRVVRVFASPEPVDLRLGPTVSSRWHAMPCGRTRCRATSTST